MNEKTTERTAEKQVLFFKTNSGHTGAKVAALAVMLVLCFLPTWYSASPYAWVPLLSLITALALSLVYLLVLRLTLHCHGEGGSSLCQRGDSIPLSLLVSNIGPLACPRLEGVLCLTDSLGNRILEQPVAAVIPPLSKRSLRFSIAMDHVGSYQAQLASIRVYSLFGLARLRLPDSPVETIQCAPRRWNLNCPQLSPLPLEENQVRSSSPDEGYDYTGVRDYVVGDPIKNIHWKLSAHSDHYLVRQLETPGSPGVSILMDFHFAGQGNEEILAQFDALTEAAWSLSVAARSQGFETDLRFFDREGTLRTLTISEGDDRKKLTALLPSPLATQLPSAARLLELTLAEPRGKKNLLFCTGQLSRNILFLLSETRAQRRVPFLYFAAPRSQARQGTDLDSAGVPAKVFTTAAHLATRRAPSSMDFEEVEV